MSTGIVVKYVGFESKALLREYTFIVDESGGDSREFTLTIANEAFVSHRARYQDGPDICSLRLHREFAAHANHPEKTQFCVTDEELADYHEARKPKSTLGIYSRKPD